MRVMVLIKGSEESEAGQIPSPEYLAEMLKFNDELVKAGVMLAGEGLHPSSKGVRMTFPERKVINGPFAETKELLAGYWQLEVKSIDDAIEWVRRMPDLRPNDPGYGKESVIEIRPVIEPDDLELTPDLREQLREQEQRIREQAEAQR
jgi:hypothetical protein